MKIFNWMHRKFNTKAENTKKNDDSVDIGGGGGDQQNKCNHVFERWRGGILAIGTLGYDPLKDENQQLCFFHDETISSEIDQFYYDDDVIDEISENSDEEEEEEVESDEEEVNPLVVAADSCDDAEECLGAEMEENWSHEFEYVMMKKKERTTLADLFYADSDDRGAIEKETAKKTDSVKEKSNRKQRLLFRKKLVAGDARPIQKLNQLVRRMLKRKIHPEVGPVNSKVAARKYDDYASLLPAQDTNI